MKIWFQSSFNTLRPRQNGWHFADYIFKRIFFNENVWISIKISLKFVPKGPINKIPALFQIMAWCRPGNKPSSEANLVSLLMHQCVTRPQWVKITKDTSRSCCYEQAMSYLLWAILLKIDHLLRRTHSINSFLDAAPIWPPLGSGFWPLLLIDDHKWNFQW